MGLISQRLSFSGERIRNSEVAGLTLTEAAYPSGLKMASHAHDPAYFSLVLEGGYSEQFGSQALEGRPSTLIFHPPGAYHAVNFHDAQVRIFRLEVKPAWLARAREHGVRIEGPLQFSGGRSVCLAVRLYDEFQEADEASPLAVEGLALELLAEASRHLKKTAERRLPRWLDQAKQLLHEQFSENLTLEEIAHTVGVHPVYLAREFRRHFHCTVSDYVRRLRIECACRKLAASDSPLVDIAHATGFYDQSHFSRTFKRITGLTPAEYRTAFRAG